MKQAAAVLAIAILGLGAGAATVPDDQSTIEHVLNRMAFGPRPGEVEKIRAIGVERYIDRQLHPERIQDADMPRRLADLMTIGLSSREIAERFERPQMEARRERRRNATGTVDERPMLRQGEKKPNTLVIELAEQKLLRAIYSERQLQEVLTDFWFNHFNVDARKGRDRFLLTEYERDTIRPRVLGKFRDLLEADAKSPAMLFYLDNWMNAGTGTGFRSRARGNPSPTRSPAQGPNARNGLNENYARELMELHTLGVDGGYTQTDVTEVARAFTGWTIGPPRRGGEFTFEPRLHDVGEKVVLGHRIKAGGGMNDGEQVLDILAKHPSTARFIAAKLVRRFVSDTPPAALVDRAAKRFRDTDGDLREVMRTILTSPEFLAPETFRAKAKTPFEFIVSAVRTTGADVQDPLPLVRAVQQLGMPLYQCQPPTGYTDTADAWLNTGALVNRMNFAVRLARNHLPGVALTADAPEDLALAIGGPEFQRR
jgi:uncharacterized protein (DUF1800 family)